MILRLVVTVAVLIATTTSVQAHDYQTGKLRIDHPTARPTRPGQPGSAAYMMIENNGTQADRLLSAKSTIARKTEIHSMVMDGNVMKMREVTDIEIKPGTTVVMQPGDGYHIMLIDLKKPLKPGDKFPLSLNFEKAGKIDLSVWVEEKSAASKKSDMPNHQHNH